MMWPLCLFVIQKQAHIYVTSRCAIHECDTSLGVDRDLETVSDLDRVLADEIIHAYTNIHSSLYRNP